MGAENVPVNAMLGPEKSHAKALRAQRIVILAFFASWRETFWPLIGQDEAGAQHVMP
jgi:hypothetical protein